MGRVPPDGALVVERHADQVVLRYSETGENLISFLVSDNDDCVRAIRDVAASLLTDEQKAFVCLYFGGFYYVNAAATWKNPFMPFGSL